MKYTAEEVRAIAKRLHDDITVADGDALMASDMLTAYAERIKADEGAVPAWVDALAEKWGCCLAADHFMGPALKQCAGELLDAAYGRKGPPYKFVYGIGRAIANPPAQAAQVDRSALLQAIKDEKAQWTGDYRQAAWFALDQMMTRLEAPPAAGPTAHPTTNSPETDSRLVGEPVAQDSSEPLRPGYVKCLKCDAQMGGYGYGEFPKLCPVCQNTSHAPAAEPVAQHSDDAAVDAFAAAMKAKLAEARTKGRGGWQDKADCPQQRLSDMLRAHVDKGDPRDVANFCMFLHQRGEAILPAEPVAQGEAVYQRHLAVPGYWADITREQWEKAQRSDTRVLYTHQPAQPAEREVVGHKTFHTTERGFWHEPLFADEAQALWASVEANDAQRVKVMPDEESAIRLMFEAGRRLKDFGWNDAIYCPKDRSKFLALEFGSTGKHPCIYEGEFPSGSWWIVSDGDMSPSRPVLWKPIATTQQADR